MQDRLKPKDPDEPPVQVSKGSPDLYHMVGETIKKKKEELQNLIDINRDRYSQSPYQMRKLKTKPRVIYPKNNQDRLYLFSEGDRNVPVYKCSHMFIYGNETKVED